MLQVDTHRQETLQVDTHRQEMLQHYETKTHENLVNFFMGNSRYFHAFFKGFSWLF